MMIIKSRLNDFFHISLDEDFQRYNKTDGLIAVVCWVLTELNTMFWLNPEIGRKTKRLIYFSVFGWLKSIFLVTISCANDVSLFIADLPAFIIPLIIIAAFLIVRKQGVVTLGFRKKHNMRAVIVGLTSGLLLICIMYLLQLVADPKYAHFNWSKLDFSVLNIVQMVIFVGLAEEVTYRAFFQSRMTGIIKNKWAVITLVGFMFWAAHLYRDIIYSDYTVGGYVYQAIVFIGIHIYLFFIYKKSDNILAPALCHGLYDLVGCIMGA